MLGSNLIRLFNTKVSEQFKIAILPEDKAFPTSGSTFVKSHLEYIHTIREDFQINIEISIGLEFSIRTRGNPIQNRSMPYETLIDLALGVSFYAMFNQELNVAILALIPGGSTTGLFYMDTTRLYPERVSPDYFGSEDFSSKRDAGYVLGTILRLPTIHIPAPCNTLPDLLRHESIIVE